MLLGNDIGQCEPAPKVGPNEAKDRVAIPANLYRIKQIDCPWKSAKYRLRDRRRV